MMSEERGMKVEGLSFTYPDDDVMILNGINIDVKPGDFVCLLGQSGCGKSTLLRVLAGLETATIGRVEMNGTQIKGASLERGVVFQDYGLFPWMTAGENIVLALEQKYPAMSKQERKQRAIDTLKRVGLDEEVFYKLPKELSGGMKQRCAIARVLCINPPVLLMDEPFGALDAVTRAKLQDMLLELWSSGDRQKIVFFVTHDVDEALLLANRILVLGQRPSHIIYSCDIPEDKRPTRQTQFEDPYVLNLRNELIKSINSDVASRIA
ncbi:MAG: ABC transporter ATP-binding protein [Synergistaceae bacterium]|nr:ABC transporter ATP-binding protein [Synergistaceae bacterium]